MPTMTNTIVTDQADLIAYHAQETNQLPAFYLDQLTGKVVAEVSHSSQQAFLNDTRLQRLLSVKRQVWRAINELRQKHAGGAR